MTGSAVSEAIGQTDTEMTDARPPDPSGAGSAVSLPRTRPGLSAPPEACPACQRHTRMPPTELTAHT